MQAECIANTGASCSHTTLGVELDTSSCKPQTINDNDYAYAQTFFSLRPAHSDMARDMTGTDSRIHNPAQQEFNGDVSLALQWQQSTSGNDLGRWFFF